MITTFPTFTTLGIEHRAELEAITSAFEPYADFSFVNLYAWCMNSQTKVALLNGNLVINLPDYITGETTMYSLVGNLSIDNSINDLLQITDRLCLVPKPVVDNIRMNTKYGIAEDRDNHDYMYDVAKLATLAGGELKKKRNKAHRFMHDLQESVTVRATNTISDTVAEEIRILFEQWAEANHKSVEECKTEQLAIDRMLYNADSLNLLFTIVRIDARICGFSVHELTAHNKAICHFEKALSVHDCLYAFLIYYTANELVSRGVKSVNWQQDLGLPGLRQAKLSYQPSGFLQKYTITAA